MYVPKKIFTFSRTPHSVGTYLLKDLSYEYDCPYIIYPGNT